MSKRELRTKKLDTKVLWGVGTGLAAIGAISWFLVRHKGKKDHERAIEIEHRTDLRCGILERKVGDLQEQMAASDDQVTKTTLAELIGQAKAKLAQLEAERKLSLSIRVILENLNEAGAELESLEESNEGG